MRQSLSFKSLYWLKHWEKQVYLHGGSGHPEKGKSGGGKEKTDYSGKNMDWVLITHPCSLKTWPQSTRVSHNSAQCTAGEARCGQSGCWAPVPSSPQIHHGILGSCPHWASVPSLVRKRKNGSLAESLLAQIRCSVYRFLGPAPGKTWE